MPKKTDVKKLNIKKLDFNIFDEPIIGEIINPVYFVYFNRLHGQIKFPESVKDIGIETGSHVMFYPISDEDRSGKIFITTAISGEKGKVISTNSKKTNTHKLCFGNKKFFKEMNIAVQPPSGRMTGKNKDEPGEKGFTVIGELVEGKIRDISRIGMLIDVTDYQEDLEYGEV